MPLNLGLFDVSSWFNWGKNPTTNQERFWDWEWKMSSRTQVDTYNTSIKVAMKEKKKKNSGREANPRSKEWFSSEIININDNILKNKCWGWIGGSWKNPCPRPHPSWPNFLKDNSASASSSPTHFCPHHVREEIPFLKVTNEFLIIKFHSLFSVFNLFDLPAKTDTIDHYLHHFFSNNKIKI